MKIYLTEEFEESEYEQNNPHVTGAYKTKNSAAFSLGFKSEKDIPLGYPYSIREIDLRD